LPAQSQESRFYFKADLGGALVEDASTRFKADFPRFTRSVGRIIFDPGSRTGVTAGYQLTDWFAAEAELGGIVNTAGKYTTLADVPLLFNTRFQYPNQSRWTPYVGGGLGVAAAILDTTAFFSEGSATFVRSDVTDVDGVFAWQAFAGLRFKLNDRAGLSLEYRYVVLEDPAWNVDAGVMMSVSRIATHAFSLAFDYHF
jgi:opacity protein-like surface antigen